MQLHLAPSMTPQEPRHERDADERPSQRNRVASPFYKSNNNAKRSNNNTDTQNKCCCKGEECVSQAPFWFSHEESQHIRQILVIYSARLRLFEGTRMRKFIGKVKRMRVHEHEAFKTLDEVYVHNRGDLVPPEKEFDLVQKSVLLTTWSDDGLPLTMDILSASSEKLWRKRLWQNQQPSYLYSLPVDMFDNEYKYFPSNEEVRIGYADTFSNCLLSCLCNKKLDTSKFVEEDEGMPSSDREGARDVADDDGDSDPNPDHCMDNDEDSDVDDDSNARNPTLDSLTAGLSLMGGFQADGSCDSAYCFTSLTVIDSEYFSPNALVPSDSFDEDDEFWSSDDGEEEENDEDDDYDDNTANILARSYRNSSISSTATCGSSHYAFDDDDIFDRSGQDDDGEDDDFDDDGEEDDDDDDREAGDSEGEEQDTEDDKHEEEDEDDDCDNTFSFNNHNPNENDGTAGGAVLEEKNVNDSDTKKQQQQQSPQYNHNHPPHHLAHHQQHQQQAFSNTFLKIYAFYSTSAGRSHNHIDSLSSSPPTKQYNTLQKIRT